ncbi:hypothetical protein AGDE_14534 [Angomonas deanei]|nr:hypothetical protein AGDE_14534 [Angomonas deanei]|eukprot:EPY20723.1 hypothetical protein AGDE_14534 [Angomonas deanei]
MKACVTKDVNADCLKFLLVTRPDFIRSMDVNTCCTPLHCVCAADYHTSLNAEAIKLLLVSGAAAGVRNKDGLTPLHLCILFPFQLLRTQSELLVDEDEVVSQATEAIDLLLMLGNADINERTSRHETPLHLISKQVPHTVNPKAVESIALKMVYFLSTRGADPSLKTPYNNKGTVAKLTPGEMAHHTGQLRVSAFLDGLVLQNE